MKLLFILVVWALNGGLVSVVVNILAPASTTFGERATATAALTFAFLVIDGYRSIWENR